MGIFGISLPTSHQKPLLQCCFLACVVFFLPFSKTQLSPSHCSCKLNQTCEAKIPLNRAVPSNPLGGLSNRSTRR